MRSLRLWGIGVFVVCGMMVSVAQARDIYVATTGSDSNSGTIDLPYRLIKTAISRAASGDVIRVREGIYNETWIEVTKSNLTLISEDGLYAAKVFSNTGSGRGFRCTGVSNIEIRGFECYSIYNMGTAGDGLIRIYNSDNIRIKDCLIHDAANDCDVVKIGANGQATTNTLIENCVIYNPAPAEAGGHAQCLDAHPVNGLTVRGCWIFHTAEHPGDMLIRANQGSSNVVWENNVFGPSYDDGMHRPATSAGNVDDDTPTVPSVNGMTVRNNLFLSCQGEGAFAVHSSRNVKFYNNVIWNYLGTGAAVSLRNTSTAANQQLDFRNNIVCGTNGRPAFVALGTYTPGTLTHDYNLYWQVAAGGYVDVTLEPNSLFVDPRLASPGAPVLGVDSWGTIVPRFDLMSDSPAIDEGVNLGTSVSTDIHGMARPQGSAYDMGVCEYFAVNQAPTVDAGADIAAVFEGVQVSLHAVGSDPDVEDVLAYTWSQTAGQAVADPSGVGTADYVFKAPVLTLRAGGALTLRVDVSDGRGGTANDSVSVQVYMAGDANRDWYVNVGDLQGLVAEWGSGGGGSADFNSDNYVNVGDLQILVANWGRHLE